MIRGYVCVLSGSFRHHSRWIWWVHKIIFTEGASEGTHCHQWHHCICSAFNRRSIKDWSCEAPKLITQLILVDIWIDIWIDHVAWRATLSTTLTGAARSTSWPFFGRSFRRGPEPRSVKGRAFYRRISSTEFVNAFGVALVSFVCFAKLPGLGHLLEDQGGWF